MWEAGPFLGEGVNACIEQEGTERGSNQEASQLSFIGKNRSLEVVLRSTLHKPILKLHHIWKFGRLEKAQCWSP